MKDSRFGAVRSGSGPEQVFLSVRLGEVFMNHNELRMSRRTSVLSTVLILLSSCNGPAGQPREVPDAVYYNGKVLTVDSSDSIAEAFAVAGERFLAVDASDEVRALAGPGTELVDLGGRTVMPGLMDNHSHAFHAANAYRGMDLSDVASLAELLERIRLAAAGAGPGQAIYGRYGWDPNKFPEGRGPNRLDLDEASPDNPVVIFLSRGQAFLNSRALDLAGVTRNTERIGRVVIRKDRTGKPDGRLGGENGTVARLTRMVAPPTREEMEDLILEIQRQQLAVGLTSIRDIQLEPAFMRTYYEMWREGKLLHRVSIGLQVNPQDVEALEDMLRPLVAGTRFGDHWLRLDGLAEFNPGSMWREPLEDTEGNPLGTPSISPEIFRQGVLIANRYGWRPSPHTDSDGAMDLVLEAYEAADRESSIRDKRWVVEHATHVQPDQMERLNELGVVISAQLQPYRRAADMVRTLGRERAERAVPMREFMDQGLIVSGGTDWGGNSATGATNNPFLNIYFYVTRNTLDLGPFGEAQKITRAEALRVATINNAYMTFEENIKGSIEAGKLADFVILSDDIMTVPEEEIPDIRPLATFVGGRKAYSSPGGGF